MQGRYAREDASRERDESLFDQKSSQDEARFRRDEVCRKELPDARRELSSEKKYPRYEPGYEARMAREEENRFGREQSQRNRKPLRPASSEKKEENEAYEEVSYSKVTVINLTSCLGSKTRRIEKTAVSKRDS